VCAHTAQWSTNFSAPLQTKARTRRGETIIQARHAQVDLVVRECLAWVGVGHAAAAAGPWPAEQQLGHALFLAAAGVVQREQLVGGRADAGGFGPHQPVADCNGGGGQGGGDSVGEVLGPAVVACAGEVDQRLGGGLSQLRLGGSALERP